MKQIELDDGTCPSGNPRYRFATFNDVANFYLSKIPGKERFWWESVDPRRMLEISYLLKKEDVMDRVADQLDELDEHLRKVIKHLNKH